MILFHGTSQTYATGIEKIGGDVTRGGGELGRGFYLTDQLAFAVAWAKGQYGPTAGKVVEFDISNSSYATLNVRSVSQLRVCSTWYQLKLTNRTRTYLFGVDVVFGPICHYPHITQHKFESNAAETLLNNSLRTIL